MTDSKHDAQRALAAGLTHDGEPYGAPRERCCMCRTPTNWWHPTDVALCPSCSDTPAEKLPTKREWCDKERALRLTQQHAPRAQTVVASEPIPADYGGTPDPAAGLEGAHAKLEWVLGTLWEIKEKLRRGEPIERDWNSQVFTMASTIAFVMKQVGGVATIENPEVLMGYMHPGNFTKLQYSRYQLSHPVAIRLNGWKGEPLQVPVYAKQSDIDALRQGE